MPKSLSGEIRKITDSEDDLLFPEAKDAAARGGFQGLGLRDQDELSEGLSFLQHPLSAAGLSQRHHLLDDRGKNLALQEADDGAELVESAVVGADEGELFVEDVGRAGSDLIA